MRKSVIPAILCFLFFLPQTIESKQLFVKMSFGLLPGGKVYDIWQPTTSFFGYKTFSREKSNLGMDVTLEFTYKLNSNIGFSLGTGYISRTLKGNKVQFIPPETSDFIGNFNFSPELSSEIYPFYLSALFSFSLTPAIQWNFLGGAGFYFGTVKCSNPDFKLEYHDDWAHWNYFIRQFESNPSTIGYHIGTGIDMDLSLNMYFSVEAFYRIVNFRKFKTSFSETYTAGYTWRLLYFGDLESAEEKVNELEGNSTFLYAQRILGEEEEGEINYRISKFSLTGFSFRAGLKFRF